MHVPTNGCTQGSVVASLKIITALRAAVNCLHYFMAHQAMTIIKGLILHQGNCPFPIMSGHNIARKHGHLLLHSSISPPTHCRKSQPTCKRSPTHMAAVFVPDLLNRKTLLLHLKTMFGCLEKSYADINSVAKVVIMS